MKVGRAGMAYQEPLATVLAIDKTDDVVRIELRIDRVPAPPIAPAGLYDPAEAGREIFPLHRLTEQLEDRLVFESYETAALLPPVGSSFILQSWWLPGALDAVLDMEAEWELEVYPDNGEHEHCLLTYERIAAYADCQKGYRSHHGWVTPAAYEQYIRRDVLRLRCQKGKRLPNTA